MASLDHKLIRLLDMDVGICAGGDTKKENGETIKGEVIEENGRRVWIHASAFSQQLGSQLCLNFQET